MEVTTWVLTANTALAEPAKTVTWLGAVRFRLLLDSVTLAPPAGAGVFKVTVQVVVPPPGKVVGLQASEDKLCSVVMKLSTVVCETPLKLAVSTAEPFALTAFAALAVKAALVAPVGIVTDPGTVTNGFPLNRLTTMLPVAAPVNVTVHVALAGGVNVLGLQLRPESPGTGP